MKKPKKLKKQDILNKLYKYFDRTECCVRLDGDILYVNHSLCTIYIEGKNVFSLSFEVNCEPTAASSITQQLIEFGNKHKYKIRIYEPYAFIIDYDNDEIKEILFGAEAMEFHETGELPAKKESKTEWKIVTIDDLKKQMAAAVESQEFEKAGKIRDKIKKLEGKTPKHK